MDPIRDGRGWAFREGRGHGPDPVNGFAFLSEAYEATEPGYDGHVSVPVLWDRRTGQIVSNNFPDITIDLGTQFEAWADTSVRLYPEALGPQIDALNEIVYENVNNGVYRAGFATTQEAYEQAVYALFGTLDELERRLGEQPVPLRRCDHRGRHPPVGHPRQVRRGLRHPLQDERAAPGGLPQPVGVRP